MKSVKKNKIKPGVSSYKAVKVPKPKSANKVAGPKKAAPASLIKYNKFRTIVLFLKNKKKVAAGKTGLATWNTGDEAKLVKFTSKMNRARKAAAPVLIKRMRDKRAAVGRGKKRGSLLSKLGNKK